MPRWDVQPRGVVGCILGVSFWSRITGRVRESAALEPLGTRLQQGSHGGVTTSTQIVTDQVLTCSAQAGVPASSSALLQSQDGGTV